MGLQACRECGHQVSTEAPTCPHCGAPQPAELGGAPLAATPEPSPTEGSSHRGPFQQAVMGVLGWIFGALAVVAAIGAALTDRREGLILLLIAGLLLPPVTRVLRQKLNVALSPKAKGTLIFGLLFALAYVAAMDERDQNRERALAVQHRLRLRADSILASVPVSSVSGLPDSTLGLLAQWTDSSADPSRRRAVLAERQARDARRRATAEQQQRALAEQQRRARATQLVAAQQQRAARLRLAVDAFQFDDGTRCASDGQERLAGYLDDGVRWSDNEIVRVACHAIWVGMTAGQLMASWGSPRANNRSVFAEGERDQWVYGDFGPYVYLDNGIVTSYQTARR